jgi:two-component system, NarL family, invasion response regulator UvrY
MNERMNFLLIDDHAVLREGMRFILKEFYKECIIDEAENEAQAIKKIKENAYDLVVMDINMPETNALGLLKVALTYREDLKVLMFSMNSEKIHAKRYIEAGAKGFLSKDAPIDEIKKAVSTALNNKNYYSQDLINKLVLEKSGKEKSSPFDKLSDREFEIASLLLAGKSLSEISSLLNIQTSTTGTHKAKLFEKLQVKNLVELIELANMYEVKNKNIN